MAVRKFNTARGVTCTDSPFVGGRRSCSFTFDFRNGAWSGLETGAWSGLETGAWSGLETGARFGNGTCSSDGCSSVGGGHNNGHGNGHGKENHSGWRRPSFGLWLSYHSARCPS